MKVITNRLIQHFPPNHNTHMTTSITKDCMSYSIALLPSLFWCNKTDSWVCTCEHACTCTHMYMRTHNTHTYRYTHNVIVVTKATHNDRYAAEPLMSVLHYHSKPFEARLKFTIPSSTITALSTCETFGAMFKDLTARTPVRGCLRVRRYPHLHVHSGYKYVYYYLQHFIVYM